MKFNKQKIEEIKNKITSIREKITDEKKEKVPKKYYALLILMVMLGIITLSGNIREYNNSIQEDFSEYELEEQVNTSTVEIVNYQTAVSSISTDISTIEDEETVETMSSNNKTNYIMPVVGEVIKEFAVEKLVYSETLGMWKTHPGIDIKANLNTSVKSSSDGEVLTVEKDSFYGNTVKIVNGAGYTFVYGNLDNDIEVKQGDKVGQGKIIGRIGVSAAGELLDSTHLHFEIVKDGIQVNPEDLIN